MLVLYNFSHTLEGTYKQNKSFKILVKRLHVHNRTFLSPFQIEVLDIVGFHRRSCFAIKIISIFKMRIQYCLQSLFLGPELPSLDTAIDNSNHVSAWVFHRDYKMYHNFRDIKLLQRVILELMKYVYAQISNYRIIEKAMVENISLLT